jgi:predicted phage gp36 major capsid-like protein
LKDRIDRRWMRKYQELPAMESTPATLVTAGLADTETLAVVASEVGRARPVPAYPADAALFAAIQVHPCQAVSAFAHVAAAAAQHGASIMNRQQYVPQEQMQ